MSNGVLGEKLHVKVARHERCKKVCLHLFFFFSSCTFPTISIVRTNCGGVSSGHTYWKRSLKRSVQISGWLFHFPNYLFFPPKGDTCTKKEKTFFFLSRK